MIAKNNIFNIRKGPKAWKGETGATKGFVEFETREHGIRADGLRNHRLLRPGQEGIQQSAHPQSFNITFMGSGKSLSLRIFVFH